MHTHKSMLYPYAYPPIKIWFKLYPLDKKLQKKQQFLVYFMHMKDLRMGSIELIFKLLAFKKLLAYPQWTSGVPPGVRVPQVENCWTRRYVFMSLRWSFNRFVSLSIFMSLSKVLSVCVPARLFVCLNNFFFI